MIQTAGPLRSGVQAVSKLLLSSSRHSARHALQPSASPPRGQARAASTAEPPNIQELAKMAHVSVTGQEVRGGWGVPRTLRPVAPPWLRDACAITPAPAGPYLLGRR
jgi:hypothetical protein